MKIEDVFSSRGRTKIIQVLVEIGEMNLMEISRRTGLNHAIVSRHLEFLEKSGVVRQRRYGRVRMFRLNEKSPNVRLIKRFIESWQYGKVEPK